MSKYEVTQQDFKAIMGYNPSAGSTYSAPVEKVNWHEALAFCNAASKLANLPECFDCTGSGATVACTLKTAYQGNNSQDYYKCKGYRLPTEAEWEYAYRAGTTTAFYNGSMLAQSGTDNNLNLIGWYAANTTTTKARGLLAPNAWGLYDMSGNVWEWVFDSWGLYTQSGVPQTDPIVHSGNIRVYRGGGLDNQPLACRAAHRWRHETLGDRTNGPDLGFRVCRTL